MSQINRNGGRERKNSEPGREENVREKRFSLRSDDRSKNEVRVNAGRNDTRSRDRENDLYERQSI